jgi:signal transduction histidine kinase/CheY-like chemotaxis protein
MKRRTLLVHLSAFGAWAIAFGCAVGWDVLVLPWTTFLPTAGPLGTLLGLLAGALIMVVIAWNFHYMIGKCPGIGGVYSYAKMAFGPDHGYICAWFLFLAYAAIVWADATVLAVIVRYMVDAASFRDAFSFSVAGCSFYFGDMLIVALAMVVVVFLCIRRRLAAAVQIAFALMMAVGIAACFVSAASKHIVVGMSMSPSFSPTGGSPVVQFINILTISPWLFVGIEAMSAMTAEFGFPRRKAFGIMLAAIVASVAAYIAAMLIPVFAYSDSAAGWPAALEGIGGDANVRAFDVVKRCVGGAGPFVLGVTLVGALFTNLVGNTIVASRLVAAMAEDSAMPQWLGKWHGKLSARSGIIGIAVLAVVVSSLGEAVVNVIVDIALVGAAIAYAYTSAATFKVALGDGRRVSAALGFVGFASSVAIAFMFIFPTLYSESTSMGTMSFLFLVACCVAGLVAFLFVCRHDDRHRFGHSSAVWIGLFVVIIVVSHLWARQTARDTMMKAYADIVEYHATECLPSAGETAVRRGEDWHVALKGKLQSVRSAIVRNSYVQSGIDLLALALMFAVYRILRRRELAMEREKAKAKSFFFSTVSHDIRTPLNAIIGFSEMLKSGFATDAERDQAVDSIVASGKTLLGLVNDVLDLSKLESGKMEIVPEPTDCVRLLRDVTEAFRLAGGETGVEVRCRADAMPCLVVDPQRLRQIAFNLVGNAVKFTHEGYVEVRASFVPNEDVQSGTLQLTVEDTGCGISDEDLKRIGSAYVQVGAKESRNGGTGLGLAICRQLVTAMGGRMDVESELGKGSTFTVTIPGVKVVESGEVKSGGVESGGVGSGGVKSGGVEELTHPLTHSPTHPLNNSPACRRILVVDDTKMNVMVMKAQLKNIGKFEVSSASNGQDALELLRRGAERFDLVLTDMWMPLLDGEGLVKAIRADPALSGMCVVVVTADVEFRAKFAQVGFDDILLKPVTKGKLVELLSKEGR